MDFIFQHGGGQGAWIWDETIAAMEAQAPGKHRYLALDVPGCGAKRDRDTADMPFPAIVDELVADIRAAGFGDAMLVGHSQAGTVMPGIARQAPELVRRLVCVSCCAPAAGEGTAECAARLHVGADTPVARNFGKPEVPVLDQFRAMFCNDMAPDEAETFLGKLLKDQWPPSSYAWRDWSYDFAAPVTYVVCLADAILTVAGQEEFAARLRADRLVRIDAGHQVQNTRPQGLAEILLHEARAAA